MSTQLDDADDLDFNSENSDTDEEISFEGKSKKELKKAHERAVRNKLSRTIERKRLRNQFDEIDGWL